MRAGYRTHGTEHVPATSVNSSGLWARANLHKSWYRCIIVAAVASPHVTRGALGFLLLNEPGELISLNT